MTTRFLVPRCFLAAFVTLAVVACDASESTGYRATIRRTSYGIPHIVADDWGSLGFGEGYAIAEDHLCSIADQVIRVRSERAKFLGPGRNQAHVLSDLGLKALDVYEGGRRDLSSFPESSRELLIGYAAGYNRYLAEVGVDNVPGWCQGEAWVGDIDAVDLAAYGRSLFMTSAGFAAAIAAARPPGQTTAAAHVEIPEMVGASNGWGIGSERTESGGGMLLANPHYPWVGSNRFWEKQLTIPGELDVYGVGLLGVPGVAIGFNDNVGWTHTVSSGVRHTLYRVRLVDGDPTTYVYDGRERAMEARDISIEVLRDDDSLEERRQTVYRTHYGPVVAARGLDWTTEFAFAIRGANADNGDVIPQWIAMDQAAGMDAFQEAHARYSAMPWVNTISASADGRAWYVDTSSTPNLSDAAMEAWIELARTDPTRARARGMMVLDGSDSLFEWVDDPAARDPGILPFRALPQLERRDYVFNANDSYWLTNSSELLTGYGALHALQEGTPRSLRTRMNDIVLADTSPGGPAGNDGRFSLEELQQTAFLNQSLAAELLAPAVAERCTAHPTASVDGTTVDLDVACGVLASYSGRLDLDSRGAVLFREFLTQFNGADLRDAGALFAEPFDAADPVGTPRGLANHDGDDDRVLQNLARAVLILEDAGFALDVPLGELQHSNKNGERIPIHGGMGPEGVTNVVAYAGNGTTLEPAPHLARRIEGSATLRADGYPIDAGTSFIMTLEFTDSGPRAAALLTYSESGDPDSAHSMDQTPLFSAKQWRPILFRQADIDADGELHTYEVTGNR